MKFVPLIWAGLWRRRVRTILTLLSIINAFILFGLLQGFSGGLDHAVSGTKADTLITANRISNQEPLPISQLEEIRRVPGVRAAMAIAAFPGTYRSVADRLDAYAIDPSRLADADPELTIPASQLEALKNTRDGALLPSDVAKAHGLKVGDRFAIHSTFWANRAGSPIWPLQVVGVFPPNQDDQTFGEEPLINYAYLDEGRLNFKGTTHLYLVRINDPKAASTVAADIDRLFANSPHETKTVTERQLAQDQIKQIGEIGLVVNAVVGAVLFALLFSVGAVILQGVRERTPEFAILKTLGVTDVGVLGLILAESLTLCVLGAILGLLIAVVLFPGIRDLTGFDPQAGPVLGFGLALAAGLAAIAGTPPALLGMRLRIVDALAGR